MTTHGERFGQRRQNRVHTLGHRNQTLLLQDHLVSLPTVGPWRQPDQKWSVCGIEVRHRGDC